MSYNNAFRVKLPSRFVDPKGYYKTALMNIVLNKYPELTVEGLDFPFTGRTVEESGPNDIISFGHSIFHDVSETTNRYHNTDYINIMGNWKYVVDKLEQYANSKRNAYADRYSRPVKIEKYDLFYKIGTTIIPRTPKYLSPVQVNTIKIFLINS